MSRYRTFTVEVFVDDTPESLWKRFLAIKKKAIRSARKNKTYKKKSLLDE